MPSGKASKRKRAVAKPPPVSSGSGRTASPKILLIGAAVAVAAVAAILLVVTLTGGDDDSPASTIAADATLPEAAAVAALFADIPQSGATLGSDDAPVTMVEYVDLQCPFCREFVADAFPTIVEDHVRPGRVRVELRGLAFIGPDSERGMKAAQAAGLQDGMFDFVDLIYANQGAENSGWLTNELIEAAARSIDGMDVDKLLADADSPEVAEKLAADSEDASSRGVNSTPTILVGPTGGELQQVELETASDVESIVAAIEAADSS
jgi:protein-disulfide isomerase